MRRFLTLLGAAAALLATLPAAAQDNEAANSAYAAGRYDEARRLWQQGCEAGSAQDCYELAIVYRDGEGVEPDRARYLQLLASACEQDVPSACHNLGHEELRAVEEDGAQATPERLATGLAFYERACALGSRSACDNLALHRAREARESGDSEAHEVSLRQTCSDGSGAACFQLASLFDIHLGEVLRDDPKEANDALALGCERLDYDSCQNLAYHYDHAFGLERDQVRASALYHLACNDDPGFECVFLGRAAYQAPNYRGGEVLDQWRMAAGSYVRACRADFAMGCFGMARLIAKSGGATEHGDQIRSYLEQALALTPGMPIAVELLRRLDAGEMPSTPVL